MVFIHASANLKGVTSGLCISLLVYRIESIYDASAISNDETSGPLGDLCPFRTSFMETRSRISFHGNVKSAKPPQCRFGKHTETETSMMHAVEVVDCVCVCTNNYLIN